MKTRVRTLKLPLGSPYGLPINLTWYDLESEIVDVKTRQSLRRETTNGADGLISVTNAAAGTFEVTIPHGSAPADPRRCLGMNVLLKHKETGEIARVLGGPVIVSADVTTPF